MEDEAFTMSVIQAGTALLSGQFEMMVLVHGTLDGRSVTVLAAMMEDHPDAPLEGAGFVQPMAILLDSNFRDRLEIAGKRATAFEAGDGPKEWGEKAMAADAVVSEVSCVVLPQPDAADDLRRNLDGMAEWVRKHTGNLSIHSTDEGKWCAHFGVDAETKGCIEDTFLDALGHVATQHAPAPGEALMGPDDPRVDASMN